MKIKLIFIFSFCTTIIFYSQVAVDKLTTQWGVGGRSMLYFKLGYTLISENKRFILRPTRNDKNIEIIERRKNWRGQWEFVQTKWSTDRSPDSFFNFNYLRLTDAGLSGLADDFYGPVVWNEVGFGFVAARLAAKSIGHVIKYFTYSILTWETCNPRFHFEAYVDNNGVLRVDKIYYQLLGECQAIREEIWNSDTGYGRRLLSNDIIDYLNEVEGFEVIENDYISVGEKLNSNKILFSEDKNTFLLGNCKVFKLSEFAPKHDEEGLDENIVITPVNTIPGCFNP